MLQPDLFYMLNYIVFITNKYIKSDHNQLKSINLVALEILV
jgi:hypothetical protein